MVTARRSNETSNTTYEQSSARGGVQVLERPRAYEEFGYAAANTVESEAAIERRKNLDKLLNYDRFGAEMQQEQVVEQAATIVEERASAAISDEDCKPTSTTLQFGQDIDIIREDMEASKRADKTEYRLNKKGKIVLVMYALVITVIMALIVINTGVLASLNGVKESKVGELDAAMAKYSAIQTEIENISSQAHIADKAEEMGMVLGN